MGEFQNLAKPAGSAPDAVDALRRAYWLKFVRKALNARKPGRNDMADVCFGTDERWGRRCGFGVVDGEEERELRSLDKLRSRCRKSDLGGAPIGLAQAVGPLRELEERQSKSLRDEQSPIDTHHPSGSRHTMASKYAFSTGLKELRFLFCQTSEHSAATRYARPKRQPPRTSEGLHAMRRRKQMRRARI